MDSDAYQLDELIQEPIELRLFGQVGVNIQILVASNVHNKVQDHLRVEAIVPLHDRLAHCDARGANARLVGVDPREGAVGGSGEVLLVATRQIERGEAITRDYTRAPRLPGDTSEGPLRLLMQFGLPPNAWCDP